jgi:hypothetical protein
MCGGFIMTWFFRTANNAAAFTAKTGTVSVVNGSATVTGVGTAFLTDYKPKDILCVSTSATREDFYPIASVTSDTVMTIDTTAQTGIVTSSVQTAAGKTHFNRTNRTALPSASRPPAGPGTASKTSGSKTVTISGGADIREYCSVGSTLEIGDEDLVVDDFIDSTSFTAASNATSTQSGVTYQNRGMIRYSCFDPALASKTTITSLSATQSGPDLTEYTVALRKIMDGLGWAKGATRDIFQTWTDSRLNVWYGFPERYYAQIQPLLNTVENASLTQSSSGLTRQPTNPEFLIDFSKLNIIFVGDSISAGLGYGASTSAETLEWQALTQMAGNVGKGIWDGSSFSPILGPSGSQSQRCIETRTTIALNKAQGSGSFSNIDTSNNSERKYFYIWQDMVYHKILTLPTPPAGKFYILNLWLGTNDIAYDSNQTGATVWARAVTFINAVRSKFSSSQMKIVMCTNIRRYSASQSTMDTKQDAYNVLIRANALSNGVDAICDFERDTVDTSGTYKSAPYYPYRHGITWTPAGDLSNLSQAFYNDDSTASVHPSTYGYTLLGKTLAAVLDTLL